MMSETISSTAEHLFPPVVVVMYVLNAEIESQQYKECQATLLAQLLYINNELETFQQMLRLLGWMSLIERTLN